MIDNLEIKAYNFVITNKLKGARMRKIVTFILSLTLLLSPVFSSASATGADAESTARANALHELGLFQGTEKGYELQSSPTRVQGLVMLIRLIGKEAPALAGGFSHPFKDLAPWSEPYVAYAYENGLTKGVSLEPGKESFDPNSKMDAKSYATLLLRALGYNDAEGDFIWAQALDKATAIGLSTANGQSWLERVGFNRGDMVDLSYCALSLKLKDGSRTLSNKLVSEGAFTAAQAGKELKSYTYDCSSEKLRTLNGTVSHKRVTLAGVTADVLRVNPANPLVKVRAGIVNSTVGATQVFDETVRSSGALAVLTGNFMEYSSTGNYPIGHVMVDGDLKYIGSGFSSLGITTDGEIRVGRPAIRIWMKHAGDPAPAPKCIAIGLNLKENGQTGTNSVLYTPSFGPSFEITCSGALITVQNGKVTQNETAVVGSRKTIPSDGYVMFLSDLYMREYVWNYAAPNIGDEMELDYFLNEPDSNGFTLDNMDFIVSGAPRLVENGAICTYLEPQFSEARFTTSISSRTAVGVTKSGLLIFVSAGAASIGQMRELMLALGCVDAINLDGGASTGFYYNGITYRTPGRALGTTVQVYFG